MSDLVTEDGRVSFHVTGGLDAVVKAISRHTIADLEFAHPTLEEVFLTYYAEEEPLPGWRLPSSATVVEPCSPGGCRLG